MPESAETQSGFNKFCHSRAFDWIVGLTLLALVTGAAVALIQGRHFIVDNLVGQIPISWEEKLGQILAEKIPFSDGKLKSPEIQEQLNLLSAPLTGALDAQHPHFYFAIVEDEAINAFALPGGIVLINSALITSASSIGEVQGVLAHEIGHVVKRHHLRQMVKSLGIYLILDALLGGVEGILGAIIDNSSTLLTLKFSREHEMEADEFGWELLTHAGISPAGMINFFATLPEKEKEAPATTLDSLEEKLSFLSSHPALSERVKILRAKNLPPDFVEKKNPLDFSKFQSTILGAVQKKDGI